jgi:hypothetical protein
VTISAGKPNPVLGASFFGLGDRIIDSKSEAATGRAGSGLLGLGERLAVGMNTGGMVPTTEHIWRGRRATTTTPP